MLSHDPFANGDAFKRLVADPFRLLIGPEGQLANERARALLRQIMLRRESDDPEVQSSLAAQGLKPLAQETAELEPSAEEWVRRPQTGSQPTLHHPRVARR